MVVTSIDWRGEPVSLNCPSFGIDCYVALNVNRGNPGLYWPRGVSLEGLTMNGAGNAYNSVFITGAIPIGHVRNMNFVGINSNDFMGVAVTMFCQYAAGGCGGIDYQNVSFGAGMPQTEGTSQTPLLISKNVGEISIANIMLNRRGIAIDANQAGGELYFDMQKEIEGPVMPLISIFGPINSYMTAVIRGAIIDTSVHSILANYQRLDTLQLGSNIGPVNYPTLSGSPIFAVQVDAAGSTFASLGQNFAVIAPSSYNGITYQNQDMHLAPGATISSTSLSIKKDTITSNVFSTSQYQDFLQQASAPSNPAAGYCRTYFDPSPAR